MNLHTQRQAQRCPGQVLEGSQVSAMHLSGALPTHWALPFGLQGDQHQRQSLRGKSDRLVSPACLKRGSGAQSRFQADPRRSNKMMFASFHATISCLVELFITSWGEPCLCPCPFPPFWLPLLPGWTFVFRHLSREVVPQCWRASAR